MKYVLYFQIVDIFRAGPAIGPAFFPDVASAQSGDGDVVGGWRAGPPALAISAAPGFGLGGEVVQPISGLGEDPVQPLKWWWIRRGSLTLDRAIPASSDDVRRLGASARRIYLSSPPAPLSRTFSQALMAGAVPPPSVDLTFTSWTWHPEICCRGGNLGR